MGPARSAACGGGTLGPLLRAYPRRAARQLLAPPAVPPLQRGAAQLERLQLQRVTPGGPTRSDIIDFGGGSFKHPRQWLGVQWLGLALGVPSCPEPPGAL